ncbi:hypothetical protein L7F22_025064 [Adiantum nelumboides]|nr:hypothetical protein [Adiantum nelumboides]
MRIPNVTAEHDDVDGHSSGSEHSLDEELGIPSVRTPGVRRLHAENRAPGSNAEPRRSRRNRYPVDKLTYDGYVAKHFAFIAKVAQGPLKKQLKFAKNKEWKAQRLSQLGFKIEPNIEVKVVEQPRILTKEPGHDQQVAHDVDTFRKEMQEVVGLMKNLSVHMMGGGRGQGYGYGRGYGNNEGFAGGRGRGMAGRGDMFQCYNCGEGGHKSPQCNKPKRMGGDMFLLPSQIPSRAQDYIEIKGEAGPSGLTAEEKGKTKVVNIIRLDKGKDDINAMVMPVGKRTTREQETGDVGPSHKRGKQAETGTSKEKKKRKLRRHYNTSDFPLGKRQPNYNLRADLVHRKADVTFGQLMEICLRLKSQWKRMVNPMKNEPTKGSVRVLSLNELPDICPTIDAWHKRKCIGAAQEWGHGTITLYNRSGDKKKFDMATKQSLDADFDEDDDDDEYSSSEEDDGEESSELDDSSYDSDVEVSSFFLEEEKGQKQATLCLMENEDTSGPYEQIEGLMQPRLKKYYARLMTVIEDESSFEESADMVTDHEEKMKTSSFSLQALFATTADHG